MAQAIIDMGEYEKLKELKDKEDIYKESMGIEFKEVNFGRDVEAIVRIDANKVRELIDLKGNKTSDGRTIEEVMVMLK